MIQQFGSNQATDAGLLPVFSCGAVARRPLAAEADPVADYCTLVFQVSNRCRCTHCSFKRRITFSTCRFTVASAASGKRKAPTGASRWTERACISDSYRG
jgi:hypothetical protein